MARAASQSVRDRFKKIAGGRPVVFKWRRPPMYKKQFDAIFSEKRTSVIEASTKTGKTSGCIIWLVEKALAGKDGQNFWWVAPVAGMAKIAFNRVSKVFPPGAVLTNKTLLTIDLPNGAVLSFRSGDNPDSLYGEDVFAVVIDEATRCKEGVWHAVRSTMTATQAPVRIIGNVKGRKNWAYQLARRAEKGEPDMHYARLTIYDAVEAGIIPAAEVLAAERDLPKAVFKELYLAEASDDGGNPFGLKHIDACVLAFQRRTGFLGILDQDGILRDRGLSYGAIAWGWDLAKSVTWTVGCGLDDGGLVTRLARWHGAPWARTIEDVKLYTGPTPALVDQTGVGSPIVEELAKGGNFEGFTFTMTSRQQLLESLAQGISGGSLMIPEGPLAQELREFEYVHTERGVRYSAPEGADDDCVMALALAWECRRRARLGMSGRATLIAL